MKLAIQVNGHPAGSNASITAYQFIKAALAKNHEVILVFFYYDGVFNGLVSPGASAADGIAVPNWAELAEAHGIELVLCVSAAERRGIAAAPGEGSERPPGAALAGGFRIGGLGLWMDACLRCDRFVSFAA